ncbi:MAG: DUF58 domain-containing protein [Clostridiales bacterium]|jgi:uncharacterized protein (DUF58 family)|nr:DUF58 domain-containing protein [Clostridiales bacterium]
MINISVTKRFAALLLAGIALLLLAPERSGLVFAGFNVFCFALLALDLFLLPGRNAFIVSRQGEDKLYFQAENKIEIKVINNHKRPLTVQVRDQVPDWHFAVSGRNLSGVIAPFGERVFGYTVTPNKRGSFPFKKIYLKYSGGLGLCARYAAFDVETEYKIYPDLQLGKYRLIMQKNRPPKAGERRIPLRGAGGEFESMREYVEGDDYRKINWMASARENKLLVNQHEAEKNQPVFMLVDTGRPTSYSVRGRKKLDTAIEAALILSDIVNCKGDLSGLMVFDTDVKTIVMPGKGEAHRNLLLESLYHVTGTKNTSDYEGAFRELTSRQKRRGLVFIFTDFETLAESNDFCSHISILARRHIPIVTLMKNEGLAKIAEGSGGGVLGHIERGVAFDFLAERQTINAALNKRGVLCVESRAQDLALDTVNRYLTLKDRRLL